MAVVVTLEAKSQPDKAGDLVEFLERILPDTRAYAGCLGLQLVVDQDDPTRMVVLERWETRKHYETYLQWREDSGTLAQVAPLLAAPPAIRFHNIAGEYP